MDHQPLSARLRALLLVLVGPGLAACEVQRAGPVLFDGPTWAAVLDPSDAGPFDEPVGFIANQRSGRITPLDLKHATPLGDQFGAPFVWPRGIATGDQRQLGQLVTWAPSPDEVSIAVLDMSNGLLVEVPYIVGMDDDPQVITPTMTDPVFDDADGSGDSATLDDITLRAGWTTTEDWLLDFDGSQWWVTGSRSGPQSRTARTGERFSSDNGEVEFTITGSASTSDQITFSTDTGLVEHDLGGMPLCMERIPGTHLAVIGTWDMTSELGQVVLWDLDAGAEITRWDLGTGSQPWRIQPGPDQDGVVQVHVADAWLPLVHALEIDADAGTGSVVGVIDTAAPVAALARSSGTHHDGGSYDHLFIAPAGLNRVDIYDLASDAWVDVNPFDDLPDAGIDLFTPVVGMQAGPDPIRTPTLTPWGVRDEAMVVALTTFDGSLLMMDAATGCLVTDIQGAHVTTKNGVEDISYTDVGSNSSAALQIDEYTGRQVTTSTCGGLVRSETWTLTYDGVAGNWRVEGTVTGEQEGRLTEDERYVSDNGGFSIIILAGPEPSTDGDEFQFSTEEGILRKDAIVDARAGDTPFDVPGAPVVFQAEVGPTGGGWDELERRTYALVPLTGNDLVVRVRLQSWNIEVVWE